MAIGRDHRDSDDNGDIVENLAVHDDVQSWPEQAETHRLRPKAQQRAVLEVVLKKHKDKKHRDLKLFLRNTKTKVRLKAVLKQTEKHKLHQR